MSKRKDIHVMITTQEKVIKLSYDAWKEHVAECKSCQEMLDLARKAQDKEKAMWMVGFGCAMDMMRDGAVKFAEHTQYPENN